MSCLTITAVCDKCKEEFGVVIEWLSRVDASEEIIRTKCPKCQSPDWHFTDSTEY